MLSLNMNIQQYNNNKCVLEASDLLKEGTQLHIAMLHRFIAISYILFPMDDHQL